MMSKRNIHYKDRERLKEQKKTYHENISCGKAGKAIINIRQSRTEIKPGILTKTKRDI